MSRSLWHCLFLAWIFAILLPHDAHAARLNSVQSGSVTFATTDLTKTATITAVVLSKSFVVFGVSLDENTPNGGSISAQITATTTVTFQRNGTATNSLTVHWYVAEFTSGVNVQRGSVTDTTISENVTLSPAVDTARSFPLVSVRSDGVGYSANDFVRAEITTTTNLLLTMDVAAVSGDDIEWQVVEYLDAEVQTGNLSFLTTDSSKTDTITSVDTSKSWLIFNYKSADGTAADIGQKLVRGVITNATTLTFDRSNTGQTLDLTYYLIEFEDATTVAKGQHTFGTTDTSVNKTISIADTSRAIATAGGGPCGCGGKSDYSADDKPGTGWFTLDITSTTNLTITRHSGTPSSTASLEYYVVEFSINPTVQLRLVQTGSATLATGDQFVESTLGTTLLDTTKAFLVFGVSENENTPRTGQISGKIKDVNTVRFERNTTGAANSITIRWYVAEFTSGVNVQRGTVTLDATTKNVTLTKVNTYRSFPIISMKFPGTDFGDDDFPMAEITSDTNLQITYPTFQGTGTDHCEWQVVEYIDCYIQTNTLSFLTTDASKTDTVTSVDTDKSWLIYTFKTATGTISDIGQKLVHGVITNGTTLTFSRDNTGQTMDLTYYLVEFTDGTSVRDGTKAFGTNSLTADATISPPVDTSTSICAGGHYMTGGKSPYSTDDVAGVGWVTLELTTSSNLRLTRGFGGSTTAEVGWFVIQFSSHPTAVELTDFTASSHQDQVLLRWRTGYEVDNLGFHVYREDGGGLTRLTREMVAGSALLAGPGRPLTAGRSYSWLDRASGRYGAHYWLEDLDLDGTATWHGPVTPEAGAPIPAMQRASPILSHLSSTWPTEHSTSLGPADTGGSAPSRIKASASQLEFAAPVALEALQEDDPPPEDLLEVQRGLAAQPGGVKLLVRRTGWKRVFGSTLVAAGLDSTVDPRRIQLFADGQQYPVVISGESSGIFGPGDSLEFYGEALDEPWTDARAYYVVEGKEPGSRITRSPFPGPGPRSQSFLATLERKDRSIYFAALRNGEAESFFGSVVHSEPLAQSLIAVGPDPYAPGDARLEVALQGATATPHSVAVVFNGFDLGNIEFEGQSRGTATWSLPSQLIQDGDNTVTLQAHGPESDVSLVDSIRLTFWQTYQADQESLRMTLSGGHLARIEGFTHPMIRVFDITDPRAVQEVPGLRQALGPGFYAFTIKAPGEGERTLLAFSDPAVKRLAAVKENRPSVWSLETRGADVVILSHERFIDELRPLVASQQSEGYRVAVVDIEDIYDEYSFGHKNPRAIRDFLREASGRWQRELRFVLLVGDASLDPKDYLGFGDFDFVPTKMIATKYLNTATDEWFVDFDGDGAGELALGRLPARSREDVRVMVQKIVAYRQSSAGELRQAVMVADEGDVFDFESATESVRSGFPDGIGVQTVFRRALGDETARRVVLDAINRGPLLVNYFGHGSVGVWRGNLLNATDARALTNGTRLPLFVAMNCLNGFFHDVYTESLAESLLASADGGALAVWASSALSPPDEQVILNRNFYRFLFEYGMTLGEAAQMAKRTVANRDLRYSWILFGDPTLKLR